MDKTDVENATSEKPARKYRTRANMALTTQRPIPRNMAIQTLKNFRHALTRLPTVASPKSDFTEAYIVRLSPDELAYLSSLPPGSKVDTEETWRVIRQFNRGCDALTDRDLLIARVLYTIALEDMQKDIESMSEKELENAKRLYDGRSIVLSAREFAQCMGNADPGAYQEVSLMREIRNLSDLYGVITTGSGFQIKPLIRDCGMNITQGTVSYTCPYLRLLAIELMIRSIERDSDGLPILSQSGSYKREPSHSYLISNTLRSVQNDRAAEIVIAIVGLIEEAGSSRGVAHISVRRLVDNCRLLSYDERTLSRDSFGKALRRAFKCAGELLVSHTNLLKTYKNLRLPDLSKIGLRDLDAETVLEFPHDGKIRKAR